MTAAGDARRIAVRLEVAEAEGIAAALPTQAVLVLSWLERARAGSLRRGGAIDPAALAELVTRARIVRLATAELLAGTTVELDVPAAPHDAGDVVPIAVVDHGGTFWSSVLEGRGSGLIGAADDPAHGGVACVSLRRLPAEPASARLSWDPSRFHDLSFPGDADSGGSYRVRVCLPLDHATAARRHPVIYLLPGLGGNEHVRFQDRALVDAADRRVADGQPGAILVGINARVTFGSWYLGAEATPWSRFLTDDLIRAIDDRFPSLVGREHRTLLGQSTGGFNAISLALTRPDAYGAIVATVPDALDLAGWLLTPDGTIAERWVAWMRLEDAVQGVGQMLSYAHSWSPVAGGGYRWPAEPATGAVDRAVLDRWLAQSPLARLEQAAAQAALRSFAGRIAIYAAGHDEFDLFAPTRRFCERLRQLQVPHRFVSDDGGHFASPSRIGEVVRTALEWQ